MPGLRIIAAMSKLADLLRRVTRSGPAPMGFGAIQAKTPPTMLLGAIAGERWAEGVRAAAGAGADAFLLSGEPGEGDLAEAVSAAEGRPCGLLASEPKGEAVSRLREAGLDFVVLEPEARADALLDEELSVILHLRDELTDVQLRTLDGMPIDAIYLEVEAGPLSIRRQVELRRIGGLARKALCVPARPDAGREDLLCLRDAGVALLIVDLGVAGATETLSRLRSVVDGLPPRERRRRGEGMEVTIPRAASEMPGAEEGEEEE